MREVAIVAAGMTRFGELWGSSLRDMFVEAATEALDGAGADRLDSMYVGCMSGGQFVGQEHLGPLMADYLREYGYADDWTLAERSVIPPEHGSLYVERILAEKRRKDRLRRWFALPLWILRRMRRGGD